MRTVTVIEAASYSVELQLWTTAIAAVAAVAAILAAIVTSVSAASRERGSWLRQEQMTACESFSGAMWRAVDEVVGGHVDEALHRDNFRGLDESWDRLPEFGSGFSDAFRRLLVVGRRGSILAATAFQKRFWDAVPLAYPRSQAVTVGALEQRRQAIEAMTLAALNCAEAFRMDLPVGRGIARRRRRRELERWARQVPPAWDRGGSTGRQLLMDWDVRRWDYQTPSPEVGYAWSSDPRLAFAPFIHPYMNGVIAAVATKAPDVPWRVSIDSRLSPVQVRSLELRIADLICHGGRGGQDDGPSHNVETNVAGERAWLWRPDDAGSVSGG